MRVAYIPLMHRVYACNHTITWAQYTTNSTRSWAPLGLTYLTHHAQRANAVQNQRMTTRSNDDRHAAFSVRLLLLGRSRARLCASYSECGAPALGLCSVHGVPTMAPAECVGHGLWASAA